MGWHQHLMTVHLHKESNKINIRRGVRHGDTISPTLFTTALKSIFRWLPWETRGLKIDGEYLRHLCFVDILICATTPYELQQMLQELADESAIMVWRWTSRRQRWWWKTTQCCWHICQQHSVWVLLTYMSTTLRPRTLKATSTWDRDTAPETKTKTRRFKEGSWPNGQHSPSTFKGNIGTCLKRQIYNSCVLPSMTYGAETWALTTQAKNKLAAAQTKMERSMLNITENKHLGRRKDKGHRRDWTSQKMEVDLGRARQQHTR